MKCDKCREQATAVRSCDECGKEYHRCSSCGGDGGCKRSIHSHKAVYHQDGELEARTVTITDEWGARRVVGGFGDVGR